MEHNHKRNTYTSFIQNSSNHLLYMVQNGAYGVRKYKEVHVMGQAHQSEGKNNVICANLN